MENIAIQTSQNIVIEQPVASIGERIAAAGIDYAFYMAYMFVILFFVGMTQTPVLFAVGFIPVLFYHLISELAMNGQSWGKKIMKIRVVKINGSQASFLSFFIRWVFRLVDITLMGGAISTITIILNGKGQRLGDIAANTTVIRVKNSSVSDTLFTRLPENYEISFPEVKKLEEKDVYTIKEVIQFLKRSGRSMEAMGMADKAKKALENKMGISSGMRSENFLFTVLRDYNYILSK